MDWSRVEEKWQRAWEERRVFEAERDESKPKFYIIFAYPGISGYLHVGHLRSYTYPDIIARYKRMRGYNVLFPAGFHASGLPAVGFARRVERGDEGTIKHLKQHGLSDEVIEKLKDPVFTVEFFSKEYIKVWKKMGFSIDFRRVISTISPEYNRFIEWQFYKLKEKNLLIQKEHYAPYCPNCGPVAVDPSETDLSKGGTAEVLEFTLIKFKCGEYVLPAATLRPETIFGVTNMWINPKLNYVVAEVDGEKWVLAKEAADKLKYQGREVKVLRELDPKELLGKKCIAPLTNREVYALPASFVLATVGTGVVMSVPAHAPYDYAALLDLKRDPSPLEEYGIDPKVVQEIEPISIIRTEGYSDVPSEDVIRALGVKTQADFDKLEEATQEVYKKEFHKGVMKENCLEFSGLEVSEAKEKVKQALLSRGEAATMLDFSEEVVCRCGTRVVIRKVENQWFIRYSDPEIKRKAHECARSMNIKPDEYKENIHKVIDWYQDRACTRQGKWLGTRFPFDKSWIIEPISDSTLYPLTYIFSKYVNEGKIKAEQLKPEFFDFIYLGKGDPMEVSEKTGIPLEVLEEVKRDYEYWYPLDLNCGGKEHMTVHFPVFIFNHVAVLPREKWPRGIFVNWWVTGKGGGKLSKSKGGAEPIPNLLKVFTADGIRLYYAHVSSPHSDVEWDYERAQLYRRRIDQVWSLVQRLLKVEGEGKSRIDEWLLSRINKHVKAATGFMENYEIKKASDVVFYQVYNDILWWLRRGGSSKEVAKYVLERWIKLMAPFTPFMAEEAWEAMGNGTFVSLERWPEAEAELINEQLEAEERYLKAVLEDVREILKVTKIKPKGVYIYTAERWKWRALKLLVECGGDVRSFMRRAAEDPELAKVDKKALVDAAKAMVKAELTRLEIVEINEAEALEGSKEFLEKELGAEVYINSEYDPMGRAKRAIPLKPAIYVE